MDYTVVGVSHHTAPIDLRERLTVPDVRLPELYGRLLEGSGREAMVVMTCNRVEVVTHGFAAAAVAEAVGLLAEYTGVPRADLESALRTFHGRDAVRHCFRVAAGLDSMVLGEPQVQGQWKAAYRQAADLGGVGTYLSRLGQRTFQVAKRVRTETEIGRFAVNLSSLAVQLAEEIFDPLASKRVTVLGAGEMAELAVTHFREKGIRELTILNRTFERARRLAAEHEAEADAWEHWPEALAAADVVLVGAGAEGHLISVDEVRRALRGAGRRPRLVIDLAVPRAVEPEVGRLQDLFLYTVDDLEHLSQENRQKRLREAADAERLISDAVERFDSWYGEQQLAPLLEQLNHWLEERRIHEVERTLRKASGDADPSELLEVASGALVRRIVQQVARSLRGKEESGRLVASLAEVFDLEAPDTSQDEDDREEERREATDRLS